VWFVQVAKWNARTTQLIERYNQVDPDEYKQLIEERETRKQELAELKTQLESVKLVCICCMYVSVKREILVIYLTFVILGQNLIPSKSLRKSWSKLNA